MSVQIETGIEFCMTETGLRWTGQGVTDDVSFKTEISKRVVVELLEERFQAERLPNGNYNLPLKGAYYLLTTYLPFLKLIKSPGWVKFMNVATVSMMGPPRWSDVPTKFNELVKKSLIYMERSHAREQGIVLTPDKTQLDEFTRVLALTKLTENIQERLFWVLETQNGRVAHSVMAQQLNISSETVRKMPPRYKTQLKRLGWSIRNEENHLIIEKLNTRVS